MFMYITVIMVISGSPLCKPSTVYHVSVFFIVLILMCSIIVHVNLPINIVDMSLFVLYMSYVMLSLSSDIISKVLTPT